MASSGHDELVLGCKVTSYCDSFGVCVALFSPRLYQTVRDGKKEYARGVVTGLRQNWGRFLEQS